MIQILEKLALQSQTKTRRSQNEIEGMAGRFTRVKRVREGLVFVVGGNSVFDPESAELKPQIKEDLRAIGKLLAGRDNKVAIRGHADSKTLSPGSQWEDLDELSYARAHAIKQFLVMESGLNERRIYLEARGDAEPLRPRAASPTDQQVNRRVEIILTEAVVEDFNSDPNFTDPSNARGG
jgi:chemotaxis protein MotB